MTTPIRITHISTRVYPQTFKHVIAQQDYKNGSVFAPYLLTTTPTEMSYAIHNTRLFPPHAPEVLVDLLPRLKTDIYQLYLSVHDIGVMLPVIAAAGEDVMSKTVVHINDYHPSFRDKYPHILNQCRGIIVPSPAMVPLFNFLTSVPTKYIPNACPERFIIMDRKHSQSETVALIADVVDNNGNDYRDYRWAQTVCDYFETPLSVYPTRVNHQAMMRYDRLMHPLPFTIMLNAIHQHMAGWAGASNDKHDIHSCVTNKLWDYLAAGIVPILYRSNAMKEVLDAMALSCGMDPERGDHLYVEIPEDYNVSTWGKKWLSTYVHHANTSLHRVPASERSIEKWLGIIENLATEKQEVTA